MPAHASKGTQYLMDPQPDLTHGGRPKLGPRELEPLEGVRMEANPPLIEVGKHPPPTRAGNWPLQAEAGSKLPQGAQLTYPQRGKERVMAGIGTKGPSGGLKGECLSPKALPTQLGPHR